ncbi:DJ-1/PfpI family protein [Methylomagnum ishizawai]|uniref:DJ-1/PfpI family protein n=1 Tax=Methylomagnum ishizawai TaxID=1760988 RepID=A0A1Y6CUW6_9GAMM|nr:DJ-1/PfpI family protein [Methylomagnum ishizawai]SMF94211.1 DJ-1/PfpI family protein [Methylomagnum ishizawai]
MLSIRICLLACLTLLSGLAQAKYDPEQYLYTLMGSTPNPNVNQNGIGIYVYDGVNSMDALGPYRVFKTAGLKTFLIAQQAGTITTNDGLKIQVDKAIDHVAALDILLIPGGALETAAQTQNQPVLDWIKRIDQTTVYTTSVCTGSWVLGAAGLLQGKQATSNWYRAQEVLAKYGASFQQERWVRDGKYWTSAGVSAGIDMALAIVVDLFGGTALNNAYAQAIMLDLEYDPKPPIRGGSVRKTNPKVFGAMQYMYDYYLLPFVQGTP